MKKKVLIYLYPQFREFEVINALSIIGKKYDVLTFAHVSGPIDSECGLLIQPMMKTRKVDPLEYEMIIIPGGKQVGSQTIPNVINLLKSFNKENIKIATIGNGILILGRAGILDGKSYTHSLDESELQKGQIFLNGMLKSKAIVEDKNLLTARSNAYIPFGLTIGKILHCFDNLEEYNFYKGATVSISK
ncbi:DJ-1/PfpI family protein [Fictibacillus halophilus]|uniref:DJ-1/PfpI family protein n=1 Tax=Fictibacillus halophilus TaxID=1610490 RepID=UPI001CFA7D1E|nr:DJ-1/PfpI family protein [Fictibacillus halophilus]